MDELFAFSRQSHFLLCCRPVNAPRPQAGIPQNGYLLKPRKQPVLRSLQGLLYSDQYGSLRCQVLPIPDIAHDHRTGVEVANGYPLAAVVESGDVGSSEGLDCRPAVFEIHAGRTPVEVARLFVGNTCFVLAGVQGSRTLRARRRTHASGVEVREAHRDLSTPPLFCERSKSTGHSLEQRSKKDPKCQNIQGQLIRFKSLLDSHCGFESCLYHALWVVSK